MQKRYDQLRVVASKDGMFVKDARGQNIHVFACNIALRAGKPPVMQMNLLAQPFDVQGVPTFLAQDPMTGEPKPVRRIEWQDGTVAEFPDAPKTDIVMQPQPGAAMADPAGARPITPAAASQVGEKIDTAQDAPGAGAVAAGGPDA